MTQAHYLVFFNLAISILILGTLFFYRYIFPHKKIPLFLVLISISTLPLFSIWRSGVPESGDLAGYAKTTMIFYHALENGILRPQWAAEVCGWLGMPFFKYFYSVPFYLASAFHFLGLSFINSIKLLQTSLYLLSSLTMFAWLKEETTKKAALVGSIFYLFAPYQLVNLHFKHAIGEQIGFVLAPLLFLIVKKIIADNKLKHWLSLIAVYSLLILSHHIVPLLITPLLLAYAAFQIYTQPRKKIGQFFKFLLAIMTGILLTAFHWLPILLEKDFVQQPYLDQTQFHPLADFIFSKWKYGFLLQGPMGELSPMIGYLHLVIIVLAIILLIRKKLTPQKNLLLKFSLTAVFLSLLMMQSFTQPLWSSISLLNNFQFSTRLMVAVTLMMGLVTALVVQHLKNKVLIALVLAAVMSTLLNWGNRSMIADITDEISYAQLVSPTESCVQLLMPKWINFEQLPILVKNRAANLEVLTGEAEIQEINRTAHRHEYLVTAATKITLKENTSYFPQWQVTANGQKIEINYQHQQFPGLIIMELEPGVHQLVVEFTSSKIEQRAQQLSLLTLLGVLIYLSLLYRRQID